MRVLGTAHMNRTNPWPTTRITLLDQIRNADDRAAWQQFVDLYASIVYRYCRIRNMQHADAQNVTQEVFSRVSRAIQSFEYDQERGRFRGWLGLITHQQMLRYREKQARAKGVRNGQDHSFAGAFEGEVEGEWIDTFNTHVYSRALASVRESTEPDEWRAFERIWTDGEQPGDIARELQRDPQWIYQVKFKLVNRLKEEVERLSADVAIFHRPSVAQ